MINEEQDVFRKLVFGMKRDIAYEPEGLDEMLTSMVVSLTKQERSTALTYIRQILARPNAGAEARAAWNACRDADIVIHNDDGAKQLFKGDYILCKPDAF